MVTDIRGFYSMALPVCREVHLPSHKQPTTHSSKCAQTAALSQNQERCASLPLCPSNIQKAYRFSPLALESPRCPWTLVHPSWGAKEQRALASSRHSHNPTHLPSECAPATWLIFRDKGLYKYKSTQERKTISLFPALAKVPAHLAED